MKLSIRIVPGSGGGYIGLCPSLPGCVTRGRSREEVRRGLDEAIRGYMAAVNNFIPEYQICDITDAQEHAIASRA